MLECLALYCTNLLFMLSISNNESDNIHNDDDEDDDDEQVD